MAEEEFQESDVVFQDTPTTAANHASSSHPLRRREKRRKLTPSVPVSVPVSIPSRNKRFHYDGGDDGEMVPPHVIVGRRVAGKIMALSICTGRGMVVKGRDLCELRNFILRVTGFLET